MVVIMRYLIAPIAVALAALLQIWLESRTQAKKKKGKWAIWGLLFVLLLVLSWNDQRNDLASDRKDAEILATNNQLMAQNLNLENSNKELANQNVTLLSRVDSLSLEVSQLRITEGFSEIRQDVSSLRPSLKMLRDFRVERESETGVVNTYYYFRANPPGTLRDIGIRLRFDGEVMSSTARASGSIGSGGAIVIESGTRIAEDSDRRGLLLTTNELIASNDLELTVVGADTLRVVTFSLKP